MDPLSDLRRFFDMSLDLLSVADKNGYFRVLNPAFEQTLGFTIDELLNVPFMELIHEDDRDATENELL